MNKHTWIKLSPGAGPIPRSSEPRWPRWTPRDLLGFGLVGLCAALPTLALADDALEREKLALIANEIAQVQALVAQAQQSSKSSQTLVPPTANTTDTTDTNSIAAQKRFRFDWLLSDLAQMRQGIEDHLQSPIKPRAVAPLHTQYDQ